MASSEDSDSSECWNTQNRTHTRFDTFSSNLKSSKDISSIDVFPVKLRNNQRNIQLSSQRSTHEYQNNSNEYISKLYETYILPLKESPETAFSSLSKFRNFLSTGMPIYIFLP